MLIVILFFIAFMSFNRSYRSCLVFYFHGSYMFFGNRGRWLWDSKHDTRFLCLKLFKLMCCARLWQWMPVRCLELCTKEQEQTDTDRFIFVFHSCQPWDVESQASWCRSTGVALSGLWSSTTALGPSEKWGKALEVDEIWWNCLEHLEAQTNHHPIFCIGWRPEGFCSFLIFLENSWSSLVMSSRLHHKLSVHHKWALFLHWLQRQVTGQRP